MNWSNLALWSAQIAVLAGAGWLAPRVFRLRHPAARLVYWQVLLVVCLALPALQPWRRETVVVPRGHLAVLPAGTAPAGLPAPHAPLFRWGDVALAALAAGMLARAAWFGIGLARLARYRRAARPLNPLPEPVAEACRRVGVYPEIALSDEVTGPVTFGFRDPVILLPAGFPELGPEVQSAVAGHELLHVRRHDWLFTAIEEMVRAVLWFHPAIWWMLGQIQLAREQAVDRAVVKLFVARERYVDALLALSGAWRQPDLAPAPLFLRRRHLTARVAAILKEADMPWRRLWVSMTACAGGLLLAGWLVCARLPLEAAPQFVEDAPGVTVTGAEQIQHRGAVAYPAEAREKGIEGTVVLDVQVAADGTVSDASVISGPMELRRGTLASVLNWHFRPAAAGRQQVVVEFGARVRVGGRVERGAQVQKPAAVLGGIVGGGVIGGIVGSPPKPAEAPQEAPPQARPSTGASTQGLSPEDEEYRRRLLAVPVILAHIDIQGLSPEAAQELRHQLPVTEGETFDRSMGPRVRAAVKAFDPHLEQSIDLDRPPAGSDWRRTLPERIDLTLRIRPIPEAASEPVPPVSAPATGVRRISVDGGVQQGMLLKQVRPAYPQLAKDARISGVVKLNVVIDAQGRVSNISVISAHPLLVPAAMEAVRQWVYKPTLLNGQPVEVMTQVDVNFTLSE